MRRLKLSNQGMLLHVTPLDNEAVTVCPLAAVKAVVMVVAEVDFGQDMVDEGTEENPPYIHARVQAREGEHKWFQFLDTPELLLLLIEGPKNIN